MIDRINRTRGGHIVTLEDPIEYLHRNEKSIVSQQEIAIDTEDYLSALRACLRQARTSSFWVKCGTGKRSTPP